MLCFQVPPLVRSIADRYKDLAEKAGIPYPMLCAYIAWTVHGMSSLSDLARLCPWVPSVSMLSAYLACFDKKLLEQAKRRLAWSVLKQVRRNTDEWKLVIDTTKNLTRAEGVSGRGLWGDSNNVIFEGQNLLVVAAVNVRTGHAVPVSWAPCIKSTERKEIGAVCQLALTLLDELCARGWPKLTVICDSWFDGTEFMRALDARGYTFVIQLKTQRKLKLSPGPRAKRHSFAEVFSSLERQGVRANTRGKDPEAKGWNRLRFASEKVVWIKGSKGQSKQFAVKVAAVYNHPRERKAFGYYATNDLSRSSSWLWKMSRVRWNVEVAFRDLRQNLSWGKLASQNEAGIDLSLFLPIAVLAYLRETGDATASIGRQLARIRCEEANRSLDFLLNNPNSDLLKIHRARNNPEQAHKKPTNVAAEKAKSVPKSQKVAA